MNEPKNNERCEGEEGKGILARHTLTYEHRVTAYHNGSSLIVSLTLHHTPLVTASLQPNLEIITPNTIQPQTPPAPQMQRQRHHHHRRPLLLLPLTILAMAASLASAFQRCFVATIKGGGRSSSGRSRLFAAAATTTAGPAAVTDARAACG